MRMKFQHFALFSSLVLLLTCLFSCGPASSPTDESINQKTFSLTNQLHADKQCFMNCYEGVAYKPSDAKTNDKEVDFILWQYTGTSSNKDSYLRSPKEIYEDATGAGQQLAQDLGINTWTNRPNAISSNSSLTVADFDAIKTRTALLQKFEENTLSLVNYQTLSDVGGNLLYKVIIFRDKNNKRGFMKINSLTSGTSGAMNVEVKMEK